MEAITAWHRPHETRGTLRNIKEPQHSKQQTVEKLTKKEKKGNGEEIKNYHHDHVYLWDPFLLWETVF